MEKEYFNQHTTQQAQQNFKLFISRKYKTQDLHFPSTHLQLKFKDKTTSLIKLPTPNGQPPTLPPSTPKFNISIFTVLEI